MSDVDTVNGVRKAVRSSDGRLTFATGVLGHDVAGAATMFGLAPENLVETSRRVDELGLVRTTYDVEKNGLPVVGATLRVISDERDEIRSIGGVTFPADVAVTAQVAQSDARLFAVEDTVGAQTAADAELVYVSPSSGGLPVLAWRSRVVGQRDGLPIDEDVFVDATTGQIVDRHPRVHTARNRLTYDAENQEQRGPLARDEGSGPSGDLQIDAAHDAAGETYDCLQELFGRDSYDNQGIALQSVANFGQNFENAFWDGQRMYYGEGFAVADVGTHEFVHAVTEATANLVYQNQPGALNEAMSDILAAVCDAHTRGAVVAESWVLGEDLPIGALRDMRNPTLDGFSRDHIDELYTGNQDNGGVHINSGIANLAFYLLSTGGQHPRGMSQVAVQGIGIDSAAQVAYRALTTYLGATSSFEDARLAMEQSAEDLYGADSPEVYSVGEAWASVGIGDAPTRPLVDDVNENDNENGQAIVDPGVAPITGGCQGAPTHAWALGILFMGIAFRRRRSQLP